MSERDDNQLWLDALAGRGSTGSATAREAGVLRDAIAAGCAQAPEGEAAAQDALREAQLVARARREGLIGPADAAERRRWPMGRWSIGWSSGWAVAAIAGVAIAVGLYVRSPPAPQVVRSSPDGIVRLQADDPAQLKQQLLADLRAAGVPATGYELLGRQGVDADLPRPLTDAARRVLEKHRIPEPADGVLRVEITQRVSP